MLGMIITLFLVLPVDYVFIYHPLSSAQVEFGVVWSTSCTEEPAFWRTCRCYHKVNSLKRSFLCVSQVFWYIQKSLLLLSHYQQAFSDILKNCLPMSENLQTKSLRLPFLWFRGWKEGNASSAPEIKLIRPGKERRISRDHWWWLAPSPSAMIYS